MRRRKKKNNLKRAITAFIVLTALWIFAFYIYVTYQKNSVPKGERDPEVEELPQLTLNKVVIDQHANCGRSRRK